jgi:hypothetical protein
MKTLAMFVLLLSIFQKLYVHFLIWFTDLGSIFY